MTLTLTTALTILILAVLATAVLTSLLTVWLVRRAFERRIRPELERDLAHRLETAKTDLGDLLRERVRQGVLDAVKSLPAPNLIRETQRSVVRTATDLVEGGLSSLLKDPRRGGDSE
jgi:hypothetical protein